MSKSAFGIEHGVEISKAGFGGSFKIPKMGGARPKGNPSAQFRAGKKVTAGVKQGVKGVGTAAGYGTLNAGAAGAAMGQKMIKNPGRTGSAILGGGGVTLTGGVYANRKKKQDGPPKPGV